MADIKNARNLMLEYDETRLLPVQLPDDYTTTGDHSGTLSGSAQTNFQNSQITLSSDGEMQGAGGGQVDLDYTNIKGTKPDANADNTQDILENAATEIAVNSDLFNIYGSGSSGVFIGSGGLEINGLRYLACHSQEEIAAAVDVPQQTVRDRLASFTDFSNVAKSGKT